MIKLLRVFAALCALAASALAFGQSADTQAYPDAGRIVAIDYIYNGTTFDRQRGNYDASVATLTAAGLGTVASADQVNYNARCAKLVIDITAISGTSPTLTVTWQGKDSISGKYFTILVGAALNATSTTVMSACPGMAASAGVVVNDFVPRNWRVSYTVGGTGPSVTATIAALYQD